MQDNLESSPSDSVAAARISRRAEIRASAVQAAASIDELLNTQAAKIEELEKQLAQAQAEIVAKNAIIAEKDRFIVDTVTRLNENIEKMLGVSDLLNSSQIIEDKVSELDKSSSQSFFGK